MVVVVNVANQGHILSTKASHVKVLMSAVRQRGRFTSLKESSGPWERDLEEHKWVGVLFWYFFGFRAPGGKKARQEETARKDRKDRKEGRKEGRKEVRKEVWGGRAGRKEVRREGRKEGRDRIFVHI